MEAVDIEVFTNLIVGFQMVKKRDYTIKLGQLVIIIESSQPRTQWQKGVITKVFTSKDGQIRSVQFKTPTGTIKRPASKLADLIMGKKL